MGAFEDSYVGQLRKFVGKRKLIIPGACAVIHDDRGHLLLVKRRDNGNWVMPAGSIELDESILDCLKREVKEETGLSVVCATPISLYSDPRFSLVNAFGEHHQLFTFVFRIDKWTGDLITVTDETVDACFFSHSSLPSLSDLYLETIQDFSEYTGELILK